MPAPPSMVRRYRSIDGFGGKHNETIGAQVVSVPIAVPFEMAGSVFLFFIASLTGVFAGPQRVRTGHALCGLLAAGIDDARDRKSFCAQRDVGLGPGPVAQAGRA